LQLLGVLGLKRRRLLVARRRFGAPRLLERSATRRELFSVRDLLGEAINITEASLTGHAATIVEAEFGQLEGFIGQL
jgi:hypothetical protein